MNLSQHVKQVHLLEISQNVLVEVNSTPIIVCVCVCACVRACHSRNITKKKRKVVNLDLVGTFFISMRKQAYKSHKVFWKSKSAESLCEG